MADVAAGELAIERPPSPRAAWLLWLATAAPTVVGLALIASSLSASLPTSYGFPGFTALFSATFGTVGGIVLARRPGNRVALVLVGVGLFSAVLTLATGYAYMGLVAAPGSLPFAPVAAWLMAWIWLPLVLLAGPVLLSIFPDGRYLSPGWRAVVLVAAVSTLAAMVILGLRAGPLENFPTQDNPFGVLGVELSVVLRPLVLLPMTGATVVAAISLLVRYRRSDRDRQHQLKWIAVAAAAFGLLSPLGFTAGKLGQLIFIVTLCGIPIAAGIAVLRYRLYDIDTIINRAIVYGLLTAVLTGMYTASVGLMQRLFQSAGGASSEAALVLTTVVIVTTFTPIKNRLQKVVDRRFKEYVDVVARLESFAAEVRSRLSALDERRALRRFLEVVVDATGAPAGRLDLDVGDESTWSVTVGEPASAVPASSEPAMEVVAARRGRTVRVSLTRARRSAGLPRREHEALRTALEDLLDELG